MLCGVVEICENSRNRMDKFKYGFLINCFDKNVPLMSFLKNAKNMKRVLTIGTWNIKLLCTYMHKSAHSCISGYICAGCV